MVVMKNFQLGLDASRLNDLQKSLIVIFTNDGLLETIGRLEKPSSDYMITEQKFKFNTDKINS